MSNEIENSRKIGSDFGSNAPISPLHSEALMKLASVPVPSLPETASVEQPIAVTPTAPLLRPESSVTSPVPVLPVSSAPVEITSTKAVVPATVIPAETTVTSPKPVPITGLPVENNVTTTSNPVSANSPPVEKSVNSSKPAAPTVPTLSHNVAPPKPVNSVDVPRVESPAVGRSPAFQTDLDLFPKAQPLSPRDHIPPTESTPPPSTPPSVPHEHVPVWKHTPPGSTPPESMPPRIPHEHVPSWGHTPPGPPSPEHIPPIPKPPTGVFTGSSGNVSKETIEREKKAYRDGRYVMPGHTSIEIPSMGLRDEVLPVGTGAQEHRKDHLTEMVTPADPHKVGEWPQLPGKRVLDGHITIKGKPGPFYDMAAAGIHNGVRDIATVKNPDGTSSRYEYGWSEKTTNPHDQKLWNRIFSAGDPKNSELITITCTGPVDVHGFHEHRLIVHWRKIQDGTLAGASESTPTKTGSDVRAAGIKSSNTSTRASDLTISTPVQQSNAFDSVSNQANGLTVHNNATSSSESLKAGVVFQQNGQARGEIEVQRELGHGNAVEIGTSGTNSWAQANYSLVDQPGLRIGGSARVTDGEKMLNSHAAEKSDGAAFSNQIYAITPIGKHIVIYGDGMVATNPGQYGVEVGVGGKVGPATLSIGEQFSKVNGERSGRYLVPGLTFRLDDRNSVSVKGQIGQQGQPSTEELVFEHKF